MELRCIDMLVAEHRAAENVLGELDDLMDDFLSNAEVPRGGKAAALLRDHSRWLIQELRSHLFKEERVLFPFAEARLTGEDDQEVVKRFEAIVANPRLSEAHAS